MAKQVVQIENRINNIHSLIESSLLLPKEQVHYYYDVKIIRTIINRLPIILIGTLGNGRQQFSLSSIPYLIDDVSWDCVMPNGFTKKDFSNFANLIDCTTFSKVVSDIDLLLAGIDILDVDERVYCIAMLIDTLICRNKYMEDCPDWKSINKQLSDCIGGYCFLDNAEENNVTVSRFVDRGKVTHDCFDFVNDDIILEVDAQHGLYSLYAAYSLYKDLQDRNPNAPCWDIWKVVVERKIMAVCFCPLYADVVRTVLCGKRNINCNVIVEGSYDFVRYNAAVQPFCHFFIGHPRVEAVIGHPKLAQKREDRVPSCVKAYNFACDIHSYYVCLTFPLLSYLDVTNSLRGEHYRWMICNPHIVKLCKYLDSTELMSNIDIKDGLGYFLCDDNHTGNCLISTIWHNYQRTISEHLPSKQIFLQFQEAEEIVKRIFASGCYSMESISTERDPFGWDALRRNNIIPTPSRVSADDVCIVGSSIIGYLPKSAIIRNQNILPCYKVATSINSAHLFSKLIILKPGEICNSGYFIVGCFNILLEAENCVSYLQTKFVKFLTLVTVRHQSLSRYNLIYVPLENFNNAQFTDAFLYHKYALSQVEIDFIDFYLNVFWNYANTKSVTRNRRARGTYLPNGIFVPETLVPYVLTQDDITLFDDLGKKENGHLLPLCDAMVAGLNNVNIDNVKVSLPEIFLSDALPFATSGVDSLWGIMKPFPGEDWGSERIENIRKHLDEEKYWRVANGYEEPALNMGEGSRDVDQLLGIYDHTKRRIIIYERAVQMVARVDGVNADVLRAVVIVHEFGHWLSHMMPYGNSVQWKDDLYIASDESIHEAWAQLIDFWAIDIAKGQYEVVFKKLLGSQSPLYHVFQNYISYSADRMLKSLPPLRQLNPAIRRDWDQVI